MRAATSRRHQRRGNALFTSLAAFHRISWRVSKKQQQNARHAARINDMAWRKRETLFARKASMLKRRRWVTTR
jgi:hypothetical protein